MGIKWLKYVCGNLSKTFRGKIYFLSNPQLFPKNG